MEDKKINNDNDISLEYKNHDVFFNEYFEIRKNLNKAISEFLNNTSKEKVKEIIEYLNRFINWSSNYIQDIDDKRKKIDEISQMLPHHEKTINRNSAWSIYDKINDTWDSISKDNQIYEILPKPHVSDKDLELEEFWRNEESISVREAKKAFVDLLSNFK